MDEGIFRKSSLKRISSPEQLTDYIRVTNPSMWVVLIAVAVLLSGVLIWSVFGVLTDTLQINALVRGDSAVCYVDGDTVKKLTVGMTVKLGEVSGTVADISELPISADALGKEIPDDYTLSRLTAGEWNYAVKIDVSGLPDGLYQAQITVERIRPISFLWN